MDHPMMRMHTRAAMRIFHICLCLSFPPYSLSLPLSFSLCTDANETTADLHDIYVRFSRTLLLARRAFVDDDRVDVYSVSRSTHFCPPLDLFLSRVPAPRSFFCSHARTKGSFSFSHFCSFYLFPSSPLCLASARTHTSANGA